MYKELYEKIVAGPPSRQLDAEIEVNIKYGPAERWEIRDRDGWMLPMVGNPDPAINSLLVTTDIESAASLIPASENLSWSVTSYGDAAVWGSNKDDAVTVGACPNPASALAAAIIYYLGRQAGENFG